jgi:excisionase family DNA binding protein
MLPPSSGTTHDSRSGRGTAPGTSLFDETFLKPGDVAKRLGLTPSAVYRMAKEGRLPSIKITERSVRIPAAALDAYLRLRAGDESYLALRDDGSSGPAADSDDVGTARAKFEERTRMSPAAFRDAWRHGQIEDTPENAALMIDALSLSEDVRAHVRTQRGGAVEYV